jgi:hypothetical protein
VEDVPILIWANKVDKGSPAGKAALHHIAGERKNSTPGDHSITTFAVEISDQLNLKKMVGHEYWIQPCIAKTARGLQEGIKWLAHILKHSEEPSAKKKKAGR